MVIVEPLAQTRIDGACFWLDAHTSCRSPCRCHIDRVDAFWFTLLHEIRHVENGDGKGTDDIPLDVDLVGEKAERSETKPEREKKADAFASKSLIPEKEIRNFIARIKPLYSKVKIVGFASRRSAWILGIVVIVACSFCRRWPKPRTIARCSPRFNEPSFRRH